MTARRVNQVRFCLCVDSRNCTKQRSRMRSTDWCCRKCKALCRDCPGGRTSPAPHACGRPTAVLLRTLLSRHLLQAAVSLLPFCIPYRGCGRLVLHGSLIPVTLFAEEFAPVNSWHGGKIITPVIPPPTAGYLPPRPPRPARPLPQPTQAIAIHTANEPTRRLSGLCALP
jgi:hypothetical protein